MTTNIFERAVCIEVSLSRLGTRRKVSTGAVEVEADKSLIHVSKDILDSPELKAVETLDGEIRRFVQSRCLPSPLRSGVYLLPVDLIKEVDDRLEALFAERRARVEAFLAVYPAKTEEAKGRLNGLFNPLDYPPVERVRASFGAATQYLTFGVPGQLEQLNKALFDRETEKARARITEAGEEVVQVLYGSLKELTDRMVDRLTPGPDGKPKTFKNTLVTNMEEFLRLLPARNLTGDVRLEELAKQAQDVLRGVTPKALRDQTSVRDYVRANFEQVKRAVDAAPVMTRTRLVLDEEAA